MENRTTFHPEGCIALSYLMPRMPSALTSSPRYWVGTIRSDSRQVEGSQLPAEFPQKLGAHETAHKRVALVGIRKTEGVFRLKSARARTATSAVTLKLATSSARRRTLALSSWGSTRSRRTTARSSWSRSPTRSLTGPETPTDMRAVYPQIATRETSNLKPVDDGYLTKPRRPLSTLRTQPESRRSVHPTRPTISRSEDSCTTSARAGTASGVTRLAGPDTETADLRLPGTATATHRTPSSCSPSSIA